MSKKPVLKPEVKTISKKSILDLCAGRTNRRTVTFSLEDSTAVRLDAFLSAIEKKHDVKTNRSVFIENAVKNFIDASQELL